jgi:hypothetical protein
MYKLTTISASVPKLNKEDDNVYYFRDSTNQTTKIIADSIIPDYNGNFLIADLSTGYLQFFSTSISQFWRSYDVEKQGFNTTDLYVIGPPLFPSPPSPLKLYSQIYVLHQVRNHSRGTIDTHIVKSYDSGRPTLIAWLSSVPLEQIVNTIITSSNVMYTFRNDNQYMLLDLETKSNITSIFPHNDNLQIVNTSYDMLRDEIYILHYDIERNQYVIDVLPTVKRVNGTVIYDQTIETKRQFVFFDAHFAVHDGKIFTVNGNKIVIYDATKLDSDNDKPNVLSQYIMTAYPEDHDNECVFAVTSNGTLVVAGYDQDVFYILTSVK